MSGGYLKLTTYFGERDRTPHGLLADQLHAIYAEHALSTSIMLRGAEGFGRVHRLHTDRLLTLSEDLPVISVAVDASERIEPVLGRVLELARKGLVTLERARVLDEGSAGRRPLERLHEETKLTVYLGRQERIGGKPAFAALTALLHSHGIAGASVLLGVDGTRRGRRARAMFFSRNRDVPMMLIAIGSGERIGSVLPELAGVLREPLVTLERVRVCKRDGRLLARPHALPATDSRGRAILQKLTVHASNAANAGGVPLPHAIVRRLLESELAGATVLRGTWGFHGDHAPHGDRLLQIRRHVPALTIAIDTPERIARAFEIVDELTCEHGLVTSEMVPASWAPGESVAPAAPRLAEHDF